MLRTRKQFTSLSNVVAGLFVVLMPALASAQVIQKTIGLFNVFVGILLTAALLTYFIGFGVWCTRLGTWPSYRTEAVKTMEWSVVILFVLVALLAIVQFFQNHSRMAAYIVATAVVVVVLGGIFIFATKGEEKEKH